MAAPKFVPVVPVGAYRDGEHLPPAEEWRAARPADLEGAQPRGTKLGNPGPDQGYALKLANSFHGKLALAPGENEHDVIAGCLGVALKRASLYGRAPVIHDLRTAFTLFGYLGDQPAPRALVEWRTKLFEAAGHHYEVQRHIADLVSDDVLRLGDTAIGIRQRTGGWDSLFDIL
jgi:hypothetical protein